MQTDSSPSPRLTSLLTKVFPQAFLRQTVPGLTVAEGSSSASSGGGAGVDGAAGVTERVMVGVEYVSVVPWVLEVRLTFGEGFGAWASTLGFSSVWAPFVHPYN